MSIGLDLGSTQFRSIRQQGARLTGRTCTVETLSLPDTPAHRRLLDRDRVGYVEYGGQLQILGAASREWSELLSIPVRPLLTDGLLPSDDGLAKRLLGLMVDAVLPMPRIPGEVCCLTIPGELLPTEDSPERQFFLRLIRMRGYTPLPIGQGHALVLAELSSCGFSGLGISIGASISEFSLNHSGRELARCAIPWGLSSLPAEVQQRLISGSQGTEKPRQQLTDFLVELLLEAGERIAQHDGFRVLQQPVGIVIGGGIAALPDMAAVCDAAWQRAAWPIRTRFLNVAPHSEYAIARGGLIRAALEAQNEVISTAA